MKAIVETFVKLRTIYNKKQQIKFCFLFVLISISGLLELVGISLILPFINVVINPEIIITNKYLYFVYNLFHITNTTNFLILLAVALIMVYILKNFYMLVVYFFQYKILYNAQKDMSLQLIKFYVNHGADIHAEDSSHTTPYIRVLNSTDGSSTVFSSSETFVCGMQASSSGVSTRA